MSVQVDEYARNEQMTLKGMLVQKVMPNDILCSGRLCNNIQQHPGNQRFAAFLAKNYKRLASSSKYTFDKKGAITFLVSGFMQAPNGGRFLAPMQDRYIILTRTQAVEWVYNSLKSSQTPLPKTNETDCRDETIQENRRGVIDIDSHVASILRAQKEILIKMKREGKIQCDIARMA